MVLDRWRDAVAPLTKETSKRLNQDSIGSQSFVMSLPALHDHLPPLPCCVPHISWRLTNHTHSQSKSFSPRCQSLTDGLRDEDQAPNAYPYWLPNLPTDWLTRDISSTIWLSLKNYLQKMETCDSNFKYHIVVAHEILETDPRIPLPPWLVESMRVCHPPKILAATRPFLAMLPSPPFLGSSLTRPQGHT